MTRIPPINGLQCSQISSASAIDLQGPSYVQPESFRHPGVADPHHVGDALTQQLGRDRADRVADDRRQAAGHPQCRGVGRRLPGVRRPAVRRTSPPARPIDLDAERGPVRERPRAGSDVVLEEFGAERTMFGSDWPVCLLARDYADVVELAHLLTAGLSDTERTAVFSSTAARLYGIGVPRPGADGDPDIRRPVVALTDEAIDKIKELITSGRLRPGEKLPRGADLAAELGLSRNSLREAVKALSMIYVLDVRQGTAPTRPAWRHRRCSRR
jgi:Amidohydrolase/Bacterial regulatory proteins, gntR family